MAIVTRALQSGVVDLGQLTKSELRELKAAVRTGVLWETTCYDFPIPKRMWIARPPAL